MTGFIVTCIEMITDDISHKRVVVLRMVGITICM